MSSSVHHWSSAEQTNPNSGWCSVPGRLPPGLLQSPKFESASFQFPFYKWLLLARRGWWRVRHAHLVAEVSGGRATGNDRLARIVGVRRFHLGRACGLGVGYLQVADVDDAVQVPNFVEELDHG